MARPVNKRQRENDDDSLSNIKLPKVFDGTYFEPHKWDGKSIEISSICQLCKKILKGQYTSTGNYYKHYRNTHGNMFDEMKKYCDSKLSKHIGHNAPQPKESILKFVNHIDQEKVSFSILHIFN